MIHYNSHLNVSSVEVMFVSLQGKFYLFKVFQGNQRLSCSSADRIYTKDNPPTEKSISRMIKLRL